MLTGNIPTSLTDLDPNTRGSLVYASIGYNALYTSDAALSAFLDDVNPDWETTQTIAPSNISCHPLFTSTELRWTPIIYQDNGTYLVYYSTTAGGPYQLFGAATDKSTSKMKVTGLNPSTIYYFVIRTITDPHAENQNTVMSEQSEKTSETTSDFHDIRVSGGGGGCFIATADYESRMSEEVELLKEHKDSVVLTTLWGRALVRFYYKVSTPLAYLILRRDNLRMAVRSVYYPP
jgi:hypothetical protein